MHLIDNGTQVGSLPAPRAAVGTPGYAFNGDPGTGVPTIFDPDMGNTLIAELAGLVTGAGLTLDRTNRAQVLAAINALIASKAGRGALASITAAQTFATGTETAITWPTPLYDTNVMWSGASPTRFTIPAGVSLVQVFMQVTWEGNATGERKIRILKNGSIEGSGLPASRLGTPDAADVAHQNAAGGIVPVSPGDYLQVMARQTSGGNLNLRAGGNTWVNVVIIK